MISRAVCAQRVCLSCRLGLARRRVAAGAGSLSARHDLGLRRHASEWAAVQKKELIEALISGQVSMEEREKATKRERARQKKRLKSESEEPEEWEVDDGTPFDWRTGLQEPLRDQNAPPPKIRTAASPDEPWPEARLSWRSAERNVNLMKPTASHEAPQKAEEPTQPEEQREEHQAESRDDAPESFETAETPDTYRPPISSSPDNRPFRHEFLRQQQLSIDALGKQVDALIIKNPDRLGGKSRGTVTMPQSTSAGDLDWKSMLSAEDGEVDAVAEATKYIGEMRPIDVSTIPRNDFYKLREALVFGFTKDQLALYYRQRDKLGVSQPFETPSYPWLISQTAWKPSNPEEPGKMTTKHQLARLIMVNQWGLQIQEEVESPGLATVTVRSDVFHLVAQSHTGVLDTLTAELLDESIGETITPNGQNQSLEIYASKAAVPTLLARIDELVQSIITRSVSIKDLSPDSLQKDVLGELARVTKTVIQHDKNAQQLTISRIAQDDLPESSDREVATPIEDSADIVLRLLRGRPTQHLGSEEQVIARRFRSQAALTKAGMLVPHCRENRSMAWRDKLKHWSRFVASVGVPGEFKGKCLKFADKIRIPEPGSAVFEDGAANRLTATFGHVLHSKPETRGKRKAKQSRRRILAPVVPNPASFTEFMPNEESDLTTRSSIVLNFTPSPGEEGPEVRLTLPITPEDDFSNFSMPSNSTLNAIVPWFVKDTLVPEEAVDARIVQQREMPLDVSGQTPIQQFFSASEFNLAEGRLRTPSSTQFSVPKRWLDEEDRSTSIVDVPYMFAGLEIHQTVDLAWKSHILHYNSIEAGQHGGTRQELSIEGKITDEDPEKAAAQRQSFLKLLEMAIEGKYWSWARGSEQIRELPDEDDPFWIRSERASDHGTSHSSQDGLGVPVRDGSLSTVESSFIEELSPGPSEPIDIGEECEDALHTGKKLAESVKGVLQAQSELGVGKDAEGPLRARQLLAQDVEETLQQPRDETRGEDNDIQQAEASTQASDR